MSRTNHVPSYRRHKQSGQALVTLPDGLSGRRDVLLGKYGTKESRIEYARIIAEWEAAGRRLIAPDPTASDLSVNELIAAFWKHAEEHYRRPDGTPSNELSDYRLSLRPLKALYGHTPARDFGPLALKAIRQKMIEGYDHPKYGPQPPLCRGVVNQRVGRIRRMFRWGVEQELVSPLVLQGLQAVRGLQRGRSKARETEPIRPIPEVFVEACLPHMLPPVAAMAQLQLLTGMRPGEVIVMRALDLDMTGKVWLYRPGSDRGPYGEHKTAWHGHHRIIALGPRAQKVIRPFLNADLQAYLFSPAEGVAHRRRMLRKKRKTSVQPSQLCRAKRNPKCAAGRRYTVTSYDRAINRACLKADRHAHEQRPDVPADQVLIPAWHPNQLRHTKATEIRREAGLDAARVVLGHRSPQITEVYAEIDVGKAVELMAKLG